jgi:SnoaL-like protein
MSQTIETLLRRNLLEIFGERDETCRRRTLQDVMAEDVVFSDPEGRHVGRDAVNTAVAALLARFPGFVFAELTPPQVVSDAGYIHWGFGPPDEQPRVTGMDVVVVREGKIAALYTFLDAIKTADAARVSGEGA